MLNVPLYFPLSTDVNILEGPVSNEGIIELLVHYRLITDEWEVLMAEE